MVSCESAPRAGVGVIAKDLQKPVNGTRILPELAQTVRVVPHRVIVKNSYYGLGSAAFALEPSFSFSHM